MTERLYSVAKVVRPTAYLAAFVVAFLVKELHGLLIAGLLIIVSEVLWRYAKMTREGVPTDEREEYISMLTGRAAVDSFLVISGIIAIAISIATYSGSVSIQEDVRRAIQGYYLATLLLLILYAIWHLYYNRKTG